MKKLTDVQNIIQRSKAGWSDSRIAEELGMSRNTVRKYRKQYWEVRDKLNSNEPGVDKDEITNFLNSDPKYDISNRKPYKYTKELDDVLEQILAAEEKRQQEEGDKYKKIPKTKIHRRILGMGYQIGYTTISKKIDEKRLARGKIEPWHDPES